MPLSKVVSNSLSLTTLAASGAATLSSTLGVTGVTTVQAGTAALPAITTTGDTNTGIFFPAADTIAFTEGGVESIRINSSGNLLVGTDTNPSESQARQVLTTSSSTYLQFARTATTVGGALIGTSGQNFIVQTYTGAIGSETYTERMRIDSSGNIGINGTDSSAKVYIAFNPASQVGLGFAVSSGTFTNPYVRFNNSSGNTIGTISSNNSTVTYGSTSDYRVKTNILPISGALAKVTQLKPVTYDWMPEFAEGSSQGFIAHELAEIVPECVTGTKDEVDADGNPVYQGIDTSFLVATLTAAIQELKAIVDAQATRINAQDAEIADIKAKMA